MIRAIAPCRIAFAGGGTDFPQYYREHTGAVVNAAIDRYAVVTLQEVSIDKANVRNVNYGTSTRENGSAHFQLAMASLAYFAHAGMPVIPFDISIACDAPPGSGLGASSASTVALVAALAKHYATEVDVANVACYVEREIAKLPGGHQDAYAAVNGGLRLYRFDECGVQSDGYSFPIADYVVLAYLGTARQGTTHASTQIDRIGDSVSLLHEMRQLAYLAWASLKQGDIAQFGMHIHNSSMCKRAALGLSDNDFASDVLNVAYHAGALGGKSCGVDGGGFMLIVCDTGDRDKVCSALHGIGVGTQRITVAKEGVSLCST